ncbi:MAG: alpha/beta hydrolase [Candidatus Lokiarchaeota archaeon]|nr:alpha/beta hydrolase [Candidatus Lokiarchaeota archaeon]
MSNESGYFEGRETTKLFYQYWLPDPREIKAFIIALHDWGTHSDRITLPAQFLTEKGYAIYAFDIRGHWRNAGQNPGHIISMFDHVQKDIVLFMDVVKKDAGDKKVFLMGEGFGGLAALIYAIMHPQLDGVIASSPELGLLDKLPASKKVEAKLNPSKIVKYEINQKVLTSDLKILKKHFADKNKIEVISAETAADRVASAKWALANANNLACSALILQAGQDRIVDKKKTKKFYDKARSLDKKYQEYDEFYHELWQERGREQVYRDIFVWLEQHLK